MTGTGVFDQVVAYLQQHRWLTDKEASKNAWRYNLMCEVGCDLDESGREIFTGEHPESVIERARKGDRIAHEALCAVADHLSQRGLGLPLTLQRYIVDAALKPKRWRSGRHPIAKVHRNDAIFHAVELAISAGARATRNDEPRNKKESEKDESACSLVASALSKYKISISEKTVAGVWTKTRKLRAEAGFCVSPNVRN